ncbi:tripartite tricarboxylate transporter substrate binding protein [Aquabacterium sp. J223]|uniref:Bug family tripartite tricarboxylate transporter substrate binding protein n=1 Tax=Aquabacterium sp. J223 TaxID=2898431 RepID=UPI0021ADC6C6|nr:tripartite tricarboxylate transporter substrate binding protein [Aquabacterium sp. J223]UUX95327.1 tripartite tricarboxylate transporter substrate binding protein [Aquabacterium sp. J223]
MNGRSSVPAECPARRRALRLALSGALGAMGAIGLSAVRAQSPTPPFPTRTVRLVVPTGPGGPTDLLARMLAERLQAQWGQTVIVDNKAGAGQMIGADAVAKAAPDGHTLLLASDSAITINPGLYPKMPYDPQKDLQPVSQLASLPLLLVVHPSVPATSVEELIRLAKARPGALAYGSGGATSRMGVELFRTLAGIDMLHVPYKGSGPMVQALVANEVQLAFDGVSSSLQQVRSGRLRALAVGGRQRLVALPDVPTVAESGGLDYEAGAWLGLFAPAGTPREVVLRVQADAARALDGVAMRERLSQMGMTAVLSMPEPFGAAIAQETVKWTRIIRQAGVTADN